MPQLRACLASFDEMLERVVRLAQEYERMGEDEATLRHPHLAISYREIRHLEQRCHDVLSQFAPHLADDWSIHPNETAESIEALRVDLLQKRQDLKLALGVAEGRHGQADTSASVTEVRPRGAALSSTPALAGLGFLIGTIVTVILLLLGFINVEVAGFIVAALAGIAGVVPLFRG